MASSRPGFSHPRRRLHRPKLTGNPNVKDDWYTNTKTGEQIDFITFARSEGQDSSLLLSCGALASPTSCRVIPALSLWAPMTPGATESGFLLDD